MINLKNLFIVNTLVALSYGLAAFFVPAWVMSNYGLTLNAAGELMTRFYGAELIAHGWMTWNVRNSGVSSARSAIVSARCIGNVMRSVVAITFILSGQSNMRGLSIAGIFTFFAIAYAYFWFIKPEKDALK